MESGVVSLLNVPVMVMTCLGVLRLLIGHIVCICVLVHQALAGFNLKFCGEMTNGN